MKRIVAMILLMALLLCGCADKMREPVTFYYVRDSFEVDMSQVIGTEQREASGHVGDLNYLITMYLRGPQEENLRSPFPAGCRLEDVRSGGNVLCIVLSGEFMELENTELTLACAALAKTCLPLSGMERLRIDAVSDKKTFTITLNEDSLLLADYSAFEASPAEESE